MAETQTCCLVIGLDFKEKMSQFISKATEALHIEDKFFDLYVLKNH